MTCSWDVVIGNFWIEVPPGRKCFQEKQTEPRVSGAQDQIFPYRILCQ